MERDIRPAKVLAVDDDLDTTGTVRAMVEMDGHECHTALNGWEALAMCRQHHFDCMFLDARLGSLSGLAVAQRLGGQDSSLRPRHIILLTGSPRKAAAAIDELAATGSSTAISRSRPRSKASAARCRAASKTPEPAASAADWGFTPLAAPAQRSRIELPAEGA